MKKVGFLVMFVLLGCSSSSSTIAPVDESLTSRHKAAILDELRAVMQKEEDIGLSVAILLNGEIVLSESRKIRSIVE